jgi:SAM-dependent methyltransferase
MNIAGNNAYSNQDLKNCPLCQHPLKENFGPQFLACSECGLMVRTANVEVDDLYRSGWQTPLDNTNLTGGTTPGLAKNYTSELTRTLGLKNLAGKNILDFGGGRGEMTLALTAAGAKVVTIDPYSYTQLREHGMTAFESLEQLDNGLTFDGAVAIDVFEHLTDPWVTMEKIGRLLKVSGWLYLSTPNGESLNSRMNKGNWREAQNPSHLLLFTSSSLERTMQKAGFEHYRRLRWSVDFSENKLIQVKDWLLRAVWLDGVLRYIAYV